MTLKKTFQLLGPFSSTVYFDDWVGLDFVRDDGKFEVRKMLEKVVKFHLAIVLFVGRFIGLLTDLHF